MPYKKLIETAIPVSKINTETEREKTARNGMPSNVHIWWTRDPMAVARTSIFESLIDDPAEHPELFPSQDEQDTERERLLRIAESLSEIESLDRKEILDLALKEIQLLNLLTHIVAEMLVVASKVYLYREVFLSALLSELDQRVLGLLRIAIPLIL